MRISQLEYVLAVERTGSINLAADHLFLSQSRISSSIIQLEKELGQPLFIRSNKGIELTSFGKEFVPYARSVVEQFNQIKSFSNEKLSSLQSLTICSNHYGFAAKLVADLYKRHKTEDIRIHLKDCSRQECIESVSNHSAELAIGRIWSFQTKILLRQLKNKNVRFFPLVTMPAAIAVGKNNPLYNQKNDYVTLDMMKEFTPVIYAQTLYNPVTSIYDQLPQLHINNYITVTDNAASLAVLENTDTYTIVGECADAMKNVVNNVPGCRILELQDCDFNCQIGYFKHTHMELTPLASDYIDSLTEYLQFR